MNLILLAAAAAAGSAAAGFRADFPNASVIESPSGGRLTHASGFSARGLGPTPEAAARAFLARYGPAFGIAPQQQLTLGDAVRSGEVGRVRFERQIRGLPVFEADVIVGVDAASSVILVNAGDLPARTAGRCRISRKGAIRAALRALQPLETSDAPRAVLGWRAFASAVRPVWRVDVIARRPPGDWRTYVDAATGRVVLRTNLRSSAGLGGEVSKQQ